MEAYIAVRPATPGLNHSFLLRRASLPPLVRERGKLFQLSDHVDRHAGVYCGTLRVELEHEFRYDAQVGPRATDAPEEIRVLCLACGKDRAICSDDSCL